MSTRSTDNKHGRRAFGQALTTGTSTVRFSYQHLTVTLQRNVRGGTAGARGGGCIGTHGQFRTLRKFVGRAMTRMVHSPLPRLSTSVTHSMLECAGWAHFDDDCSLEGGG
jgi:hypothetical protein